MAAGGRLEHDLSSFLRHTANDARAGWKPRERCARFDGQPRPLHHRAKTAPRGSDDGRGLASRLASGAHPQLQGAPYRRARATGSHTADADHHGVLRGHWRGRSRPGGLRSRGHHFLADVEGEPSDRDRERRPRPVQPHSRSGDHRAVSREGWGG